METLKSIAIWSNETFKNASVETQFRRAKEEMDELEYVLNTFNPDSFPEKIAEEAADVVICLYRIIWNLDPEAIEKKMKKNRIRKWKIDETGCGQHIEESKQ
jgi:uncharacterized protein YabN with tetrapyrrole methylase and pyrophosphatase domain